jgi:glycosyltransferase involved in cell wall biosynthesis
MVDGVFLYGNYAKNLMVQNGFNSNKLHVIHNSLDYDVQLPIRDSLTINELYKGHFKNGAPVLCFIGRLTSVKKIHILIDALYIMNKRGTHLNLILIGDGEERKSLEDKVNQLELSDRVWFYGESYDERTNAELLYNADLCVAPGNIGLTAMHAMMFGCPCMSHDDFPYQMPEFEAIIPNQTGNFFKRDDVQSLADSIENWFAVNGNRREEIRKACYQEIDMNWNPHKQIEIFKQVIYQYLVNF